MKVIIEDLLISSGSFAILVSIIINIVISVAGIIPSFFITAANITFFGFHAGLTISYIGECIGAMFSFWLYRVGIKTINPTILGKNKWLAQLQHTEGWNSFFLIIALRIFPYIPSGMVNLSAAISKTGFITFIFASSLGKLPALIIEAYTVKGVIESTNKLNTFIAIIFLLFIFLYFLIQKRRKRNL